MSKPDTIKAHITRAELEALCSLRMAADPAPVDDADNDLIGDFLDRAAAEFGYTNWVQAANASNPHGGPQE